MNKTWKMIAIVLLITTAACGQQRGRQGGPPQDGRNLQVTPPIPSTSQIEKMIDNLAHELLLTDTQKAKVLTLYKTHFELVKEKVKSGKPDRTEMKHFQTKFEKSVKAELTENQKKLYAVYLKKNQPKNRNK